MRRCKWLRRSTINYEIPDISDETDYLIPLVQIGLLQDSKKICFYFKKKNSILFSFFKFLHWMILIVVFVY